MKKGIVFGTVRAALPDGTLADQMALAAKSGFDGVELQHGAERDFPETISKDGLNEIKDTAAEAGIELPSIMPAGQPIAGATADERKSGRDVIVKVCECAAELGAETVLIVPGRVSPEHPYGDLYKYTVEAMQELSGRIPEGVVLAVENVWNKFLYSPLEFARIIDEIDRGRIEKVHVKDYKTRSAGAAGFCNLLEGDVDFADVIKALGEAGYDGYVTAEVGGYSRAKELGLKAIAEALDAIIRGEV